MKTAPHPKKIKVSARELVFFKNHWLSGLPTLVSNALRAEGRTDMNRSKVHRELTTIKHEYDADVINKAREIIKVTKRVEFNPNLLP